MLKSEFVYFDAGGGHRAAATALKAIIEQEQRPIDVHLMNLQDVLDELDIFRRYTGIRMADYYNRMLASGFTFGSEYLLRMMQSLIRLYHRPQVRMLTSHWQRTKPDLVVSVVPNFNRALGESVRRASATTPFVTILTDFADYPPHFWIERQQQYLICGSERAVEQARELGHAENRIYKTSGMILRPTFYREFTHDRAAERQQLGLEPECPTGIVLFGGQGSAKMLRIASRLEELAGRLQLILVCGRNAKLAQELRSIKGGLRTHVVEFTDDVPYYMNLADFFIGKPGPGSISEAIAMKLPVIVERNSWTLPQERFNADWVTRHDVGEVVESFDEIATVVRDMLQPVVLDRMKRNVASVENRAVFEIPDILQEIAERGA